MVAGMLMPLDNLKAIYEHLFRDGVMVAKKDKRPQTKHPEIPGVDNLQVIRAMGSLKSRGYVRETFAWKHYYWYLTNEGIVYLRDYLHLPPEIVPTPLQRVRRPAATLAIARRAERVQAIQGPTSYVPKPGKMGAEEAFLDRQEYRRKTASMDEAEVTESGERVPRFRGRPMTSSQIRPKGSWESKEQPMRSDAHEYTREMEPSVRRKFAMHSASKMPPIETYHAKPVEQENMADFKECTKTSFIQKTQKLHASPDVSTISSKVAGESLFAVHTEEKPKQEVSIKVSHETAAGESKAAKDARHPTPSKPKVEKTQKTLVTKNVQDVPVVSSAEGTTAVESSLFSVHTKAVKEKPKEGEFVKVFQQTTSTVIGDSKTAKDFPQPTPSKPKEEKTQKTTVVKNVQNVSLTVEATSGKSSVSSVPSEAAKEKPKEDVFVKVYKKATSTVADKSKMAKDALHLIPSEPKVKKTQQTLVSANVQDVPAVFSAVETTAVKSSVSIEAVKEKEEASINVSQTTPKADKDSNASHPAASKPKAEKTQKTTKTKILQDIPIVSATVGAAAVQSSICPVTAEAAEEKPKPKEEVCVSVSQETTSKRDSKSDKDAARLTLSKVEKTQQATFTKNVEDVLIVSSAVETAQVKEKPKEDVCTKVSLTTSTGDSKFDKDAPHLTASKTKVEKTQKTTKTKNVQDIPTVSSTAVESSVFSLSAEAVKEKPKEEVFIKVSQETTFAETDDSKMAKDAPPSKPKAEKTQKTQAMKTEQDVPAVSSAVETTAVKSSVSTEAVKEKPKEEVCVSVSQETISKGDSKEDKDALCPTPSQPKVEKMLKTTKTKTVQSSVVSVSAETVKEKPKEEVFIKVSQETTFTGTDDNKTAKDASHLTPLKPKVEKTQKTKTVRDVPAVSSAVETTSVKSSISTEAVTEKPKEEVCVSETTPKGGGKEDKDASCPLPSKLKVEKMQKTTKTKNGHDIPTVLSTVETTTVQSSVVCVSAEAVKEKPKEDVFMKVSQETTFTLTDDSKTAKDALHPTPSKPNVKKTNVPAVLSAVETTAVKSSVSTEAVKEKPKEEVCVSVSLETTPKGGSKEDKDAIYPLSSKTKVEKTQKTTKTKNGQDILTVLSTMETTAVQSSLVSVSAEAVKEKPKEEVFMKVSQKTTFTGTDDSKMAKDAPSLKPKEEKTQKTKTVQDVPAVLSSVETTEVKSSFSTEAVKEKPKEEVCVSVSQESTPKGDSKEDKDASLPTPSQPKVEKKQKTTKNKNVQDIPTVLSTVETTAVQSSVVSVSAEAVKEKPKEVFMKVSQETTFTGTDDSKTAKDALHPTPSKLKVEKTNVPAVSSAVETIAVNSSFSTEAVKEKPKEEVCVSVSLETTPKGGSKEDKDAIYPLSSKTKVEKTQKNTKTKNGQDIPTVLSTVETTAVQSSVVSVSAEAVKEKPKEEVFMKVSQKTTFTGTDDSKMAKDAPSLKPKEEKTQKTKTVRDVPAVLSSVETTEVKSSVSTEAVKEKPKEEVCVSVSQETTPKGGSKEDKDAIYPIPSKTKVEKTQKTTKTKNEQDIPTVLSTMETTAVQSSAEAVKEKPKEEVFIKISQETTFTGTDDSKAAKDALHPTPSKPKVEKTQKTKTVQDVPAVSSVVETTAVKSSFSTETVKEKPKEEVCVSVSQETTPKGGSKEDKDASCPVPSKQKVEKMQKTTMTKNVQDVPSMETTAVQSSVVSVSTEAVKEKPKEEVCINVSVETTSTSYSKTHKDAPHPSPSKPNVEKTQKTMLTKNVQEQPIENKKADVTNDVSAVHADEMKSSISISTQVPVKSLESTTALEKTKDAQEASKDDHTKVHKKVEIPCAISAAEVKAEVKGRKPELNPVSQSPSTGAEVKITATDSSKTLVVAQTKKLESNKDSDSVQQKPSPAKLTEEPVVTAAKDGETEDAWKPSKGKKKKQKSASKSSAVKQVPPPTAETKVIEVKTENAGQVDLPKVESPEQVTTNDSAKTSSEGMHAVESTQPTAVQNEAPAHKGEVEPAQPSAEKREVLKGKTSSSLRQREAPAASASAATAAAASAQLTPLPEQGEPPSIAQHTPAPDTQQSAEKQNRLSDSKAPVITGPLPADENTCDAQQQSEDDAMRKKIVVVEEVIEVQQIASPIAGQPVTPPAPEITGDDLDYDVLEELAIERGILQDPFEEPCWDHSLQEPEAKTFPNFIEGMSSFQFFH
ncbi:uncharacterized protein [Garra rufa]|uniref:uncharacterized protein n=1 Tax=Garra rufa TaxID=137080 RepID=UPI003CCEBE16